MTMFHLTKISRRKQKGLTLIEVILVIFLSIPCILLIQSKILSVFIELSQKNMLSTFVSVSRTISDRFLIRQMPGFRGEFQRIDASEGTDTALFNISYDNKIMTFYGHYSDDEKGFYTLGILTPDAFLYKPSLSTLYNILGGGGGIVRNGEFISFDKSISGLDLHTLKIPDNSVAYFLFQPVKQEVRSDVLDAVFYSGESIVDYTLNLSSCDVVCSNSYLTFVWNNIGFTNLGFYVLVNGDQSLPFLTVDLNSGMAFVKIQELLDFLKMHRYLKNASISFYIEGESIATKKKRKTFFKPNLSLSIE